MQDGSIFAAAKEWLSFIALCVALGSPLVLLWLKSQFATKDEIAALRLQNSDLKKDCDAAIAKCSEQFAPKDLGVQIAAHAIRIDRIEDRTASVEGEMRHLPDKQTTHRLELAISDMRGEMRAMGEKLSPVAAIADRLQEFLLEQAKR